MLSMGRAETIPNLSLPIFAPAVLLRNLIVLDPASPFHNKAVDIVFVGGGIQSIAEATGAQPGDTPQAYISPGWVDTFADYREPGYETRETIATGLNAAAAGGFTDVLLAPNTQPAITTKGGVQYALRQAEGHAANLHPMGALSQEIAGKKLAEMLDMHAHGAVAFTDGWQPVQDAALLLKALEYVKAFDGVVVQLPDDKALSAGGLMHEGDESVRLGMPGIPAEAEELMVYRDVRLARYAGSRLHLSGISTVGSVDIIRKAKAEGIDVTCSCTPYHLALSCDALGGYDSQYKVNPPLRTEADRQALIEALADGTVDCIATHHRPQDWDAKNKEFEYAGWGMAIQELAFPVIWNAVWERVSLERLVDALAIRPRTIFGLPTHSIAEGAAGSFTIFSPEAETNKPMSAMQSLAWNNPFSGQALRGSVVGIATAKERNFAG